MNKILLTALLLCCMALSSYEGVAAGHRPQRQGKSIVVLYENDVHCGVDGYAKIAGLRNAINSSDTAQCIIVSSGDYLQGGTWGALSKGRYIVDIMNAVGYSAATIGNHEFDYGTPHLLQLMDSCNVPLTCVNFSPMNVDRQYYKPYIMTEVAGKRLAFVGVVTPTTMSMEYYSFYDRDHRVMYDLYPDIVYQLTQQSVDSARTAGADYVILLSHLGEQDKDWSSIDMIRDTRGIDMVLDGHTHSIIPDSSAVNIEGRVVHFTQTGTKFANIGKLTISPTGQLHTELLPTASVTYTDSLVSAVCDSVKRLVSDITDDRVGYSDHVLTIRDSADNWIVRTQEMPIGNLVADAYRHCLGAEIGIVNGGGLREDFHVGDITYGDVIDVSPYFNDMEVREVPGSLLRIKLNDAYSMLPQKSGAFLQVSGLKVRIELGSGYPTVTDIQVEDKATGQYRPLDDNRIYTVASTNYVFGSSPVMASCKVVTPSLLPTPPSSDSSNASSGASMGSSLASSTVASSGTPKDTEILKLFITDFLHGSLNGRYLSAEGRITITQ